ncbi:MAG: HAD family hydrolase [Alphaproteobacteria bacterium]|nr:HAD family hydrolase [Alphaproteobacteria bacterium]
MPDRAPDAGRGGEPVRIAMWSGPRNISTAMMRSFGARSDCAVYDEPFYAAFLYDSGQDHPMRGRVIASQPTDWRAVVRRITGPAPEGRPIWYQKHMGHHMMPHYGLNWVDGFANAFLVRDPARVAASYTAKWAETTPAMLGYAAQRAIFDRAADRLGHAPPVVDAEDILADPRGVLTVLCRALGLAFDESMLSWTPGRRDTDGVWAEHWYGAVERSTGFHAPQNDPPDLNDASRALADACRDDYQAMSRHRITPT